MKKQTLLLFIILLTVVPLLAQYSPCYEAAIAEGKRLYDAGKSTQAKKYFNEAKKCPDPNTKEADEWIKKCNDRIKENEAAKTAYMRILHMDYCNVDNGQMIDDYGAPLYQSKLKELQPRITYDAILNETKNATLSIKVYNPSGILVTGKDSPSGYTYSAKIRVLPGKGKTLLLPIWDNNGLAYSVGEYKYELWYRNKQLFESSFFVLESDLNMANVSEPVEKKAEIVVFDNDGKPLEGAKLLVVGTNKYELTNSEGVGRIDLSDMDTKKIQVSHKAYREKQEVWVCIGDQKMVVLTKSQKMKQIGFQVAQYVVPGLYQIKSDRIKEGVAFAGGETLLLTTGLISNVAAKRQLRIMESEDVSLSDYQNARLKYKAHRAVNIISYTSAILVYGAHLYRTYTLANKYGNLSMSPAVMYAGDEMAVGLNLNIKF